MALDIFYKCSRFELETWEIEGKDWTGMQLSDAEWKVMDAVWCRRGAVTAREVLGAVADTGWAYTTVKTMMDRLMEKGALEAERNGKTTFYRARVTRGRARRAAARSLVDRAFGGTAGPLVHHLVRSERLSPEERDELRRMLDEQAEAS